MQRFQRLAAVVAVVVAASGSLALSASPAEAHAPCGKTVSDKDAGNWNATAGGANIRTGSSTSCAKVGIASSGHKLDYHCYTVGEDGYTWTYLRDDTASPDVYGWVRDDLLRGCVTSMSDGVSVGVVVLTR